MQEERRSLVEDFLASTYGTAVRDRWPAASEIVAHHLVDHRIDYSDGDPYRWSPVAVEICLVDWSPRTISLADDQLDATPDVLRAFVRFSAQRKGLAEKHFSEDPGSDRPVRVPVPRSDGGSFAVRPRQGDLRSDASGRRRSEG